MHFGAKAQATSILLQVVAFSPDLNLKHSFCELYKQKHLCGGITTILLLWVFGAF